MKFYPPDDQPVQVALTTGHIAVVEAAGTELEPRFQREAIALGCMPEGIERDKQQEGKGFDKMDTIINGVIAMVENGEPTDFTSNGLPKTDVLSKRVGFTVSRGERDAAWDTVSDESNGQ